jgi:uncharacterized protein YndB with AHSA1/START domain
MPTLTTTATINQPVETIFNYIVDVANHKSWQASNSDAQVTPRVRSASARRTPTPQMSWDRRLSPKCRCRHLKPTSVGL